MPPLPPPIHWALMLSGTLVQIAAIPNGLVSLAACLLWWSLVPWTPRLAVAWTALAALFALLDLGAVRAGVFAFARPDLLGLPWWEFLVWGCWVLGGLGLIPAAAPARPRWPAFLCAALFAAPFLAVADPWWLTALALAGLAPGLVLHHRSADLVHLAGFALIGLVVELTGVLAGVWSYPQAGALVIPPASLVMWAGIGLFAHRLVRPWLILSPSPAQAAIRLQERPVSC